MTDESTNAAAAMPPYAKREPKRREFHGDVFEDDYEWMRDKDSDDVRSYVAAHIIGVFVSHPLVIVFENVTVEFAALRLAFGIRRHRGRGVCALVSHTTRL